MSERMKISVLGAGAWGSALAVHFCAQHEVTLWARNQAHVKTMSSERLNSRYLPDIALPPSLDITHDLRAAAGKAELLLVAVPSGALRDLLTHLAEIGVSRPLIWVCKGFEKGTGKLPHEIVGEILPHLPSGVLSGPSFALEVAKGLPTAVTLASHDAVITGDIAQRLHGGTLRIYTSEDVVGIELGGAVKNVIAIAAGISDGLGFGYNARAALITRSLAEITRLGLSLGGHMETFMGLSGVGDLILTCTGDLSRNRQVGMRLAKGETLEEIIAKLGHVAEGVTTAPEVLRLAERHGVDMPITRAVNRILYEHMPPRQAVEELLHRNQKAEDPRQ
jgi:glycerol-3-phosphate dehydrogenase (NAD(P)+)